MNPLLRKALRAGRVVAKRAVKAAASAAAEAADADKLLMRSMAGLIDLAANRYAVGKSTAWTPGEPLKLLLVGYAGTRNTGADVRVEEMLRQFRHLFGDDHVDLSIFTLDAELTRGYFRTVKQIKAPEVFPKFLFDRVHEQHGVITCEGSMFKSKFANALSTFMVGGLGLASAENKIAVGYGGEAGAMDPQLQDLVRRYCRDAFIIARNDDSVSTLGALGVSARSGTDTAWTFDPAPASDGARILRGLGWDGEQPILAICPINPFWWPVRADLKKGAERLLLGRHRRDHYKSVYFHHGGPEVREAQTTYLTAIADGAQRFIDERGDHFLLLVGMEQLDRLACAELDTILRDQGHDNQALLISDEHDMYEMVSAIRHADLLVSSRYHAIVTSMPGSVVSAGITMDERIRNLMIDRAQPQLALEVDDPDLGDHLHETLLWLDDHKDEVREGIERCVVKNLARMGEMGAALVDHVHAHHPEFPFRDGLGLAGDPWDHLPSFPPEVQALVDRHKPGLDAEEAA